MVLGITPAVTPVALTGRPMELLLERFTATDGSIQGLWSALDLAGMGVQSVDIVKMFSA